MLETHLEDYSKLHLLHNARTTSYDLSRASHSNPSLLFNLASLHWYSPLTLMCDGQNWTTDRTKDRACQRMLLKTGNLCQKCAENFVQLYHDCYFYLIRGVKHKVRVSRIVRQRWVRIENSHNQGKGAFPLQWDPYSGWMKSHTGESSNKELWESEEYMPCHVLIHVMFSVNLHIILYRRKCACYLLGITSLPHFEKY